MQKLYEINNQNSVKKQQDDDDEEDEIQQVLKQEKEDQQKKDSKLWGTPRLSPRKEELEPNVYKKVIFSADKASQAYKKIVEKRPNDDLEHEIEYI